MAEASYQNDAILNPNFLSGLDYGPAIWANTQNPGRHQSEGSNSEYSPENGQKRGSKIMN